MIFMAWDHVSGFWNPGKMGSEGLRGYFPYVADINQFYLRLLTHVCAPAFMFLAGASMALSTRKRLDRGEGQWSISKRLATRGMIMWLLAIYIVGECAEEAAHPCNPRRFTCRRSLPPLSQP
jgi:uncharacterized membrane protein